MQQLIGFGAALLGAERRRRRVQSLDVRRRDTFEFRAGFNPGKALESGERLRDAPLTDAQSQLRQSQPFGARVATLALLLDPRNQAESFGVPALRDQVVEIFLAPSYPRSELM